MRIAVTGSIGSGKSAVVQALLQQLPGYAHFDFDCQVHALYEDPDFCAALRRDFGTCERKLLSEQAFADVGFKARLEAASAERLKAQLHDALAANSRLVAEFPLLYEAGWCLDLFELTVAVVCDDEVRQARVVSRDGANPDKIAAIAASQLSAAAKSALADWVIDTTDGRQATAAQVLRLTRSVEHPLRARALEDFGSAAIWSAICCAYSQPHRHYHTLEHLRRMFDCYDQVAGAFESPSAARWAIWFHDFVYDVGTGYAGNESRSAAQMLQLVRQHAPHLLSSSKGMSTLARATELILATKAHRVPTHLRGGAAEDAALFLDIDLEILSAQPEPLAQFEKGIRSEFAAYDPQQFAAGRSAALRSFLQRPQIYLSPAYASKEHAAKHNLQHMIDHWDAVARTVA